MRFRSVLAAIALASFAFAALPAVPAEQRDAAARDSIAAVVEAVRPSVVNILVSGIGQPGTKQAGKAAAQVPYISDIVGSGVILHPDGLIFTNNHVVDNAYQVRVAMNDGRIVPAKLIGKGHFFDIALLKIDVGHPLPPVPVGDSDRVRVGDRVFAIGDPLGLRGTVTSGIISAINRSLGGVGYNYLQTDAAMNHGNSGGPLFNMAGEVIGINNQIFSGSREGGSIGLGFAIPTDDLKFLLQQIQAYGHPRLGTIGMTFQEVTFDMSDALGVSEGGAIVTEITPGSPAALAGIKAGDIVKSYDNQKVANYRPLARAITESLGKTMTLNVWSAGTIKTASVQVQELPQENLWVDYKSNSVPQPIFRQISDFGMEMKEITSDLREQYGISSEISGPIVTNVITESAAYSAHLQAGDVVLKVQLSDVATLAEFTNSLTELRDKGNRSVLVLVTGSQGKRWTTLPLRL